MHPLIEEHKEAIRALCREFGVKRPELFDPGATDAFDPARPDVDFLVESPNGDDFGPGIGRHLELQDGLETRLGQPVDPIMTGAIRKPRFTQPINDTRTLLSTA